MIKCHQALVNGLCMFIQVYQDMPGVEHIPVVQIDLSVPLKVPGKHLSYKNRSTKLYKFTFLYL